MNFSDWRVCVFLGSFFTLSGGLMFISGISHLITFVPYFDPHFGLDSASLGLALFMMPGGILVLFIGGIFLLGGAASWKRRRTTTPE